MKQLSVQRRQKDQAGFTIIELIISTAVFSVILLICTVAVLSITQTYIKGNIQAETQNTARSIIQMVAQDIQFNKAETYKFTTGGNYFCIGNHVYSYALNQELMSGSNHVFVMSNQSVCPSSQPTLTAPVSGSSQELLSQNMRLGQLSISQVGGPTSSTYSIVLSIGYGSNLNIATTPTPPPYSYSCPAETNFDNSSFITFTIV
jgi:prepilin-type N-terminal cleavage/methylation domain-containing protein